MEYSWTDRTLDHILEEARRIAQTLYPHQVEGVTFLLGRRRAILADDMGLGKTRQSIIALLEQAPDGPYLVVCPASVKHNWAREIRMVQADAEIQILGGSRKNGAAPASGLPEQGWVILNYDILRKHQDDLLAICWAGMIFDEAHYIKNHKSQRSRMARQLADAVPETVVYALTGTPMVNRPRDLFPLLQLVHHPMGRSFLSFARRYCDAYQNDFGWVTDGASNLEELAEQMHGVMLRRTKDEVLDLPPKVRTWLPVEVEAGSSIREMGEVVRILIRNRAGVAGGRSTRNGTYETRQEADRARILAHLTTARRKLAKAKVKQTIDFVDGVLLQGEKAIVYSCFDDPVQALKAHYGDACVVLTGATPAQRRQALADRFQEEEGVRVFVANIIAGGVGLNLTAARQVVFNDLDWVPANHWQAEDRAYRIGQTGSVNVTYMTARDTVDDFVQAVLETKSRLVEAVVDGRALAGPILGDVLQELERLVGLLSPRLADVDARALDEQTIAALLREASGLYQKEIEAMLPEKEKGQDRPMALTEEAIVALAKALSGSQVTTYRIESGSKPGTYYRLSVEGGDVECTCPGFEYRGACRHARTLKSALARGTSLPPEYESP